MGGSFDPVHMGHLALARAARDRHRLERVLFVPNRLPPHKGVHAAAHHRHQMVSLAVRGTDGLEPSDREVLRAGTSYTVDTLREIRLEEGEGCEIFFIVGADTLPELPTWKDFPEILRLARIVLVGRSGLPLDPGAALGEAAPESVIRQMEADAIRAEVKTVSSSEIRERVARGLSLEGWVPPLVADYIGENNLYKETEEP